jgi:hypothetical protein
MCMFTCSIPSHSRTSVPAPESHTHRAASTLDASTLARFGSKRTGRSSYMVYSVQDLLKKKKNSWKNCCVCREMIAHPTPQHTLFPVSFFHIFVLRVCSRENGGTSAAADGASLATSHASTQSGSTGSECGRVNPCCEQDRPAPGARARRRAQADRGGRERCGESSCAKCRTGAARTARSPAVRTAAGYIKDTSRPDAEAAKRSLWARLNLEWRHADIGFRSWHQAASSPLARTTADHAHTAQQGRGQRRQSRPNHVRSSSPGDVQRCSPIPGDGGLADGLSSAWSSVPREESSRALQCDGRLSSLEVGAWHPCGS